MQAAFLADGDHRAVRGDGRLHEAAAGDADHDFVLKGKRKTEIMDGLLMAIQKVAEADIEKDVKEIILTTLKAEYFDGENNKW